MFIKSHNIKLHRKTHQSKKKNFFYLFILVKVLFELMNTLFPSL